MLIIEMQNVEEYAKINIFFLYYTTILPKSQISSLMPLQITPPSPFYYTPACGKSQVLMMLQLTGPAYLVAEELWDDLNFGHHCQVSTWVRGDWS